MPRCKLGRFNFDKCLIELCVLGLLCSFWGATSLRANAQEPLYLNQGWDAQMRERLYFTSFGSRFIPYSWFLVLEQADSRELIRAPAMMRNLGFILAPASSHNPDALAVGLVRDSDKKGGDYLGFTCAACHTGQLEINGQSIRIDGGPALIDFAGFEHAVVNALAATLAQPEKFKRFAAGVGRFSGATLEAGALRADLQTRLQELQARLVYNHTAVPYGHGRLDAFGQIFNAIAVEALALPENARAPDAPTSFPVLWDASHLDLVQWNASAPNKEPGPLFQNAITALAVYGTVKVSHNKSTYSSSIRIQNLGQIQRTFYALRAPSWPQKLAGELDTAKLALGAEIYARECLQCHTLINTTDKNYRLRAQLVPVTEVGTDPHMKDNFNQRKVKSGILEHKRAMALFGKRLAPETSPLELVTHTAAGALFNQPWQMFRAVMKEYSTNLSAPEQPQYLSYKARPLNGVWASAPYLHNGSVPSLYDLLLPPAARPQRFYVGSRELDLNKLGLTGGPAENTSLFDTTLPGNSNAGHRYGTALGDKERWALLEYLKSL